VKTGTLSSTIRITDALERARQAAHPPGEYVEQLSFMRAGEIRALAGQAGIGKGSRVLDLCCGVGGPGRLLARTLECRYLGIDRDQEAIAIARARAGGLPCRFEVHTIPPLPGGTFDVVLLLETMLAFRDKPALVDHVSAALGPGGRFAFTLEAGEPLTGAERQLMPGADTVWPAPLDAVNSALRRCGLAVRRVNDCSASHLATAAALRQSYAARAPAIAAQIGDAALSDLLAAHRLWVEWLGSGRIRKVSVVAEKLRRGQAR